MFCSKCGRKIEDGAAVCPGCGAPVGESDILKSALDQRPYSSDPEVAPAGGEPVPGKRKRWVLPAAIGGAAVACILAAVLLSGLLGGAKGTLTKALAKSVAAWQEAADSLELADLSKLYQDRQAGQRMTVRLKRLSDRFDDQARMLEGMSLTLSEELDLPARKMEIGLGVSYGSAELLWAGMTGNDSVLSLSCPALLGEQPYGADTETLGQTLYRLDPDGMETVQNASFNIFDLLEAMAAPPKVDAAASKALSDAIEVEKCGTAEVDVNGRSLRCEGYRVTIPQGAMLDCLDAVKAAYAARRWNEEIIEVMRSFGATEEELAVMEEQLESRDALEALAETLEETGDVELEVFVSDGCISRVRWTGEGDSLDVCFGGGERYADDLSLDILIGMGQSHFRLASSGNHGGTEGAYTDTTVLLFEDADAYGDFSLESRLTYDPQSSQDNFSWTLEGEGMTLAAKGQVTRGDEELFLDLENVSVSFLGEEYAALGISWLIRPCAEISPTVPVMLENMTEADLESLYADVTANAQSWLFGLMGQAPELFQLFL